MRKKSNVLSAIFLTLCSIIVLAPMVYTVSNSFINTEEILKYYANDSTFGKYSAFHLIPDHVSFEAYFQMLLSRPDYLVKFWNSLWLTVTIVCGQIVISSLAGYSFSKLKFRGSNILFYLVIVMMMMPYQVTLVSNFIVLEKFRLVGKYAAVILPMIFYSFGVFLMKQSFDAIPNEVLDAAAIDGASEIQILFSIVLPMSKPGLGSLIILGFLDAWNMVEMPLVLLGDRSQYPLSIFLAQIATDNMSLGFSCSVLALIPPLLVFLYFEDELVEGIRFSNLK